MDVENENVTAKKNDWWGCTLYDLPPGGAMRTALASLLQRGAL